MNKFVVSTLIIMLSGSGIAEVLGTAFTYQGELRESGAAAQGAFDMEFRIFDLESGGSEIVAAATHEGIEVVDGIFAVELDFGMQPFMGDQLWLEVRVRQGGPANDYTLLSPRQKVTATPYALHAEMVAVDSITDAELTTDAVASNHIVDSSIQAVDIDTSQVQVRIVGACPADSSIRFIGADGRVSCEPDSVGLTTVTGSDIADGSITGVDLAANSVTGVQLQVNSVGPDEIRAAAVTSEEVLNNSLSSADMFDEAGIEFNNTSNTVVSIQGPVFWSNVATMQVSAPGDGFTHCICTGALDIDNNGFAGFVRVGIDDDTDVSTDPPGNVRAEFPLGQIDINTHIPISAMRTFANSNGTNDYACTARVENGTNADVDFITNSFACMYFPTRY